MRTIKTYSKRAPFYNALSGVNGFRVVDLVNQSLRAGKYKMKNPAAFRFVLKLVTRMLASLLMFTPVFAQEPNQPKSSPPPLSLNLELLTDPEGIDLGPYMRSVYKAVKDKAMATIPPSVARGDQGVVSVRLWIQKDGTLAGPALPTLEILSRKS